MDKTQDYILRLVNKCSSFRERCLRGAKHYIPFSGYNDFVNYVPGISQRMYYLITASSGVGKSRLLRHMFITQPIAYVNMINKSLNDNDKIKLTIKYFSLEETKEDIYINSIISYLYRKCNIEVSRNELLSMTTKGVVDKGILTTIEQHIEGITAELSCLDVIDYIKNPYGIYKYMRQYAIANGTHYTHDGTPMTDGQVAQMYANEQNDAHTVFNHYKLNNPNHFVLLLIDHIALLSIESGHSMWSNIQNFSSNHLVTLRNRYGFTPVVVQQQAAEKERLSDGVIHNNPKRLEPSLDGLGDNKITQRDADVILGLYAPDRYGIREHNGIAIDGIGDQYRSISILKNRNDIANKQFPFRFNGKTGHFEHFYNKPVNTH